jgi:LysM repeat protein
VTTPQATSAEASPGSGPTRTLVPSDVDPTPSPSGTAEPTAASGGSTYRVKSGDTLSEIAAAHGTTWQEIARLNGITDPKRIHVGQVLKLP